MWLSDVRYNSKMTVMTSDPCQVAGSRGACHWSPSFSSSARDTLSVKVLSHRWSSERRRLQLGQQHWCLSCWGCLSSCPNWTLLLITHVLHSVVLKGTFWKSTVYAGNWETGFCRNLFVWRPAAQKLERRSALLMSRIKNKYLIFSIAKGLS